MGGAAENFAPLKLMGEAICIWKMLCTLGIAYVWEVH